MDPMVEPSKMKKMQELLDSSRRELPRIRQDAEKAHRSLRLPKDRYVDFSSAIDGIIKLNAYRGMPIGWARGKTDDNIEFKELRQKEVENYGIATTYLEHLRNAAHRQGMTGSSLLAVESGMKILASIRSQEDNLYRARRDWGRQIVAATKSALDLGAANQIEDVARTGGLNAEIYLTHMAKREFRSLNMAQKAVIAAHFGTGLCDEYAYYTMTEANKKLPGTQITIMSYGGHAGVIIGPPNHPESAHLDAWTTSATVSRSENYGIKEIQEKSIIYQVVGDGKDLRKEVASTLASFPKRPAHKRPAVSIEKAMEIVRKKGLESSYNVLYITRAAEGHNSDSDPEDRSSRGHTLSTEALNATAANNFQADSTALASVAARDAPGTERTPHTRRSSQSSGALGRLAGAVSRSVADRIPRPRTQGAR
ncbi:hypothetical protein AB0F46_42810 [Streptomyces sp. NPDC026665]|uniref:hypothetical protein n=1 Tax=Streptomyces sp. NPDC026665 TaxID=3154798 RepID=UPI0033F8B16A